MRDFVSAILRLGLSGGLATLAMAHPALAAPARGAATDSPGRIALPFIADDLGHAVAEARAKHRPIFIEAWAPW